MVLLPQLRWREDVRRWRRAEEIGLDSAWTYDHLAWRSLADEAWLATVPLLTAAATVTTRIRLGTWVASPNFRHPVPFAKDALGLDDVSDGRLTLEEHTERMERAYAARTLGELAELTADLVPPEKRPFLLDDRPVTAFFRSETRGGRWVVPTQVPVTALGGKVTMDLCDALLRSRHVVVRLAVLMGTVTLIVPEGLRIVTAPGAHITSFKNEVRPPRGAEGFPPDGPVIELAGFVFGGRVVARSPRRPRKGLFRRA